MVMESHKSANDRSFPLSMALLLTLLVALMPACKDDNPVDSDDDGLTDAREARVGTDPNDPDTDDDELTDYQEVEILGTNPLDADSDDDTLDDGFEVAESGSDPLDADSDNDDLSDAREVELGTNPVAEDTDGDGYSDAREADELTTDPTLFDSDDDGLNDWDEIEEHGTDPIVADTDLDGLNDGEEISWGCNPLVADTDTDGLSDGVEVNDVLTDPVVRDTDADGLFDGAELEEMVGTDPRDPDSDNDTLLDGAEVNTYGSDPLLEDTDGDGLTDRQEVRFLDTDPADEDTDGDLLPDPYELAWGFDPTEPGDGAADPDGDGLTNVDEMDLETEPIRADTDNDAMDDGHEVAEGTDPLVADSDDDGLNDGVEWQAGLDPLDEDSDGDGLLDGEEPTPTLDTDEDLIINGLDTDSDNDGINDGVEVVTHGTLPAVADTDGDGINDGIEVGLLLDPLDPSDAGLDPDGDGLSNLEEVRLGTKHDMRDSDGDLLDDGVEVEIGSNPIVEDGTGDLDGDGLTNYDEVFDTFGATDPLNPDSDGDGLIDGVEVDVYGTKPDVDDSDTDGVADGVEVLTLGTDPLDKDSDDDGLSEGEELRFGTDPLAQDTDGDTIADREETLAGDDGFVTEPTMEDSDSDGLADNVEIDDLLGVGATDPSDPDSDDDGLSDGDEVALGTNPNDDDCDDDELLDGDEIERGTNPLADDSDFDGVPDGVEVAALIDPLLADSDSDLVLDGDELVNGFNGTRFEIDLNTPVDVPGPEFGHSFRVALQAELTDSVPDGCPQPRLQLDISGAAIATVKSVHAVREEGSRFFNSPPLKAGPSGGDITVFASEPEGCVGSLHIVAAFITALPAHGYGLPTLADVHDSDGDELIDGLENNRGSFWLEAEHYPPTPASRPEPFAEAGNGIMVRESSGHQFFELGGDWGFEENTGYTLFVRGRIDGLTEPPKEKSLKVMIDDGLGGSVSAPVSLTDQLEWHLVAINYVGAGEQFNISIYMSYEEGTTYLDRVAIIPMMFDGIGGVVEYPDYVGADGELCNDDPGCDPSVELCCPNVTLQIDLPHRITDPMEADTDGDGVRLCDGLIEGSAGWLTDGHEVWNVGTSPFNIDTDYDGDLNETDPGPPAVYAPNRVYDDRFDYSECPIEIQREYDGGPVLPPDGIVDRTDNFDRNPLSADTDEDGILDFIEESTCPVPGIFANFTDCSEDYDRDDDGLSDSFEDADLNGYVNQDELDVNRADTDGDCIADGVEIGLLEARSDDTDPSVFRPDADDGARTTDPRSVDSDGDTLIDGDGRTNVICASADGCEPGQTCVIGFCAADVTRPCANDGNCETGESCFGLCFGTGEDLSCDGRHDPDATLDPETDASRADTDGDGIDDATELLGANPTDPNDPDHDGDGLCDGPHAVMGVCQPGEDTNANGQVDVGETDPTTEHSDTDLLRDGDEVLTHRTDPLLGDSDTDTLSDYDEVVTHKTDPNDTDSDDDGLSDALEVNASNPTSPILADTDGDGLCDGNVDIEARCVAGEDRDEDGEVDAGGDSPETDPNNADSDGDGLYDKEELDWGGDPTNDAQGPTALEGVGVFDLELDEAAGWTRDSPSDPPVAGGPTDGTADIDLKCTGAPITVSIDGGVAVDRSGDTVALTTDGTVYLLGLTPDPIEVWSGVGEFDTTTGILTPGEHVNVADILPDGFGERLEVGVTGGVEIDVCDGTLYADAEVGLYGPGDRDEAWGIRVAGDIQAQPLTGSMTMIGDLAVNTPFGPVTLAEAELEVALADYYVSGRAGLVMPQLDGVELSGPEVDVVIDPLNGHFKFVLQTSTEVTVGPVTLAVGGPVDFAFELDTENGFLWIEGGFEIDPVGFSGTIGIDLSGKLPFEPEHLIEDSCAGDVDLEQDGHLFIAAEAEVPIPPAPGLFATLGLDYLADVAPASSDEDGFFVGGNGTYGIGAGYGPISLSVELGGSTAAFIFNDRDELAQIVFGSEQGITLGDFVDDLPDALGTIGQKQAVTYCLDVQTGVLAATANWVNYGFVTDLSFTLTPPELGDDGEIDYSVGGLEGSGDLTLPLGVASVEIDGYIGWDAQFEFTGESDLTVAGHTLADAGFTFDNDGLEVEGGVDLGDLGSLNAAGALFSDGDYLLDVDGELSPLGCELASVEGTLTPDGLDIEGHLTLPADLGGVDIVGEIHGEDDYRLEGNADLTVAGYTLADAHVLLTQNMLEISGTIDIPGAGRVSMDGYADELGNIQLHGFGAVRPLGHTLANAEFWFEKDLFAGTTSLTAVGRLSVGGYSVGEANFEISSTGGFSGSGTLSFAGVQFDVTIDLPIAGSPSLSGSVSVSGTFAGVRATGSVSLALESGEVTAEFSGSVKALGKEHSVDVSVSSSGCIQISGFRYPCPTWSKPTRTCTQKVSACIL